MPEVQVKIKISDGGGFKTVSVDADDLKNAISSVQQESEKVKSSLVNWSQASQAFKNFRDLVGNLESAFSDLGSAYSEQVTREAQLAQAMRNTMGATDADIQKIKDLCSAQQELGVVGDEVQLAGAQELSTYLTLGSSLETLIPVMNDMVAQQYGLEASGESAAQIASMLGKVMNGQVEALSRYGYSFTEAQKKVLLLGEEEERAAVLAAVVGESVGGMNAALAQTDVGQQKQLENTLGDIKEQLGGMVEGALPFISITAAAVQATSGMAELAVGIQTLTASLATNGRAWIANAAEVTRHKIATMAAAVAQGTIRAATLAWQGVQAALNVVLSANPIGLIVMAIGALVTAVVSAYNNCESFRNICNQVWAVIKPLASMIMEGLAKAFEWLVEKCSEAWEWLKNILGLGGESVDVEVNVKKNEAPGLSMDELEAKYANADLSGKKPKDSPVFNDKANTLAAISDNIKVLQDKLQKATVEEAAAINQSIKLWQDKADAIKNAGAQGLTFDASASTLEGIDKNIEILQAKLRKASADEAADLNKSIKLWQDKANAIKDAGSSVAFDGNANTLEGISSNIQILQAQLQKASAEEAASINQNIKLWQDKADAIKNAGSVVAFDANASTLKGITANIRALQDELQNASVEEAAAINQSIKLWEEKANAIKKAGTANENATKTGKLAAGAISDMGSLMQSLSGVVGEGASGWLQYGANVLQAVAAMMPALASVIGGNIAQAFSGAAAQSQSVPFPYNIVALAASMGAVAAAVASIPKYANGGLAYGPTLGIFGEYAGASNNPEVVAPLNKLKALIGVEGGGVSGKVVFKQRGRNLVGVLEREHNLKGRS